jgi:uncharacterized protein with von Willebrand factor type A (vWA) domain
MGIVAGTGDAAARLMSARTWLTALEQGQVPGADSHFGDAASTDALRTVVAALGLPGLCQGVPALAEQVVRSLLWHLDSLIDRPAGQRVEDARGPMVAAFREAWHRETAGLEPELALMRTLGPLALHSWDRLRGQLRSRPWAELRQAADRLGELPALHQLIRQLGRREPSADAPPAPAPEERDAGRDRLARQALRTTLPGAPGEITGVTVGARLEHQLPAEALLLRHPVLRKLWRARHAEQRLWIWQTQAELNDWRVDPQAPPRQVHAEPRPQPRERGPIIVCLDTSGSMQGAPERIAKAVVVAALQAARLDGRRCRLLAFGGPGELVEQDLDTSPDGLRALLQLMGQSFDGGTDVQTPIERAIETVHTTRWSLADLLIVSDGEFGCTPATLERLDAARQRLGLRVQGVLVGDRETMGLLEVCDHIHWEREWRRFGEVSQGLDARRFSPVHSRSLTALYFPNALSPRAARHHPAPPGPPGAG